jgi:hypothetical protein
MRRAPLTFLLLLALVLAPFLGQVHRVLHTGAPATALAHAADGSHAHGGLASLFGDHVDGNDCRLYDQLGHADLACGVPAPALPLPVVPAFVLAWREGEALARFAALFDARGPPALR